MIGRPRGLGGQVIYDAIFVGGGINSLVGAALLARAGWSVCILERTGRPGGAIRTEPLTEPGFLHDTFSGWHPLFVSGPAYAALGSELHQRGLEYLSNEIATGVLLPDGSSAFLSTSDRANAEAFDALAPGDGEAWAAAQERFSRASDLIYGALGAELWSGEGLRLGAAALRRFGLHGALELGADLLAPARTWLSRTFRSDRLHALLTPWLLHSGMGPEDAGSAGYLQVTAGTIQRIGLPIPRGGGERLVDALGRLIADLGGRIEVGAPVEAIRVEKRRAVGVHLAGGVFVGARRAVLASVTPQQLYLRLLPPGSVPPRIRLRAERYAYGRGAMMIHLALSEPPRWIGATEKLLRTPLFHVTGGLDAVSKAVNEANRGLLPAAPTIAVGQHMALDPSRGPEGRWILWLQMQELPRVPLGDAAGEIEVGEGGWSESLRERYADRVLARLSSLAPNLEGAIRKRVVLSPRELEAANVNLVGGDPYGGACSPDQLLVFRPLPGVPPHGTPIAGLFQIGASTHPGPGLHGSSGFLAARALLERKLIDRLLGRS